MNCGQVQQQWFYYTEKVDRMVEEAFRLNVKWSLQELGRAINGDGKSGPNPLFKVQVILQNDAVCISADLCSHLLYISFSIYG